MTSDNTPLRQIPSIDHLLSRLSFPALPRPLATQILRQALDTLRQNPTQIPTFQTASLENTADPLLEYLQSHLDQCSQSRIQPVINGTGTLLHTNFGRAPLGRDLLTQLTSTLSGYCNLEYDLPSGRRGRRGHYIESLLSLLCQAPGALIVNNCASALLLALAHFTHRDQKEVIVSRGELVQIGGGFRIHEILEMSGARLREVGTTNQTHLKDYQKALSPQTALILKVHLSNFSMSGFVHSTSTKDLAKLSQDHNIPFLEDQGSGCLVNTENWFPSHREPTPLGTLSPHPNGLICFSADKLLGGPQAGILLGHPETLENLRSFPLYRALRCDKLVLTSLQYVLESYLNALTRQELHPPKNLPVFQQLETSLETLQQRAREVILAAYDRPHLNLSIVDSLAQMGGGTLPDAQTPSLSIQITRAGMSPQKIFEHLRMKTPPLIGTVTKDRYEINLRTVFPEQDAFLVQHLRTL